MSTTIEGATELERLVNRSRLIGADPALVVHGGGNTSSKIDERGRTVLRIKGSGTDLRTIAADGFPGVYLDEVVPLRDRAEMSDDAMVEYLAGCMVDPTARRGSIETLLHAFLPHRHIDHTHADAICVLTNQPESEAVVHEVLGGDVDVVAYIRPGFELSKRTADHAGAAAVVLDKHGLVTWGETHETSYDGTVELVAKAAAYIDGRRRPPEMSDVEPMGEATTAELLGALSARLCADGPVVLHLDRSQADLANRADVERVATDGRATPDHILRIGARTAVIRDPSEVDDVVERFVTDYAAYFGRHSARLPEGLGMLSPLPRVILVPGLGCVTQAADAKTASVRADIAYRSHLVTAAVLDTFGEVAWLSESDIFDFDYWPLELFKLR
ncbi:MAG TPA: class II aldolase/adducin family protein [Gaiellales bacterium]|jgi:rhamnose utilization protein RhaD (predicted bifunctional aldolase and dehydrogenase)